MQCPVPLPPGEQILLGHGSGGKLTRELIGQLFAPVLGDAELARLGDAAVVELPGGDRLAFTTDAFVVQPAFFPGSNIGELAVNGTVNDLAMMGARPLALSAALILEEGLEMAALGTVIASMADACRAAEVRLVTGDTKVVERGAADGLYVITSGIGVVPAGVEIGPERARPGDRVLVTGPDRLARRRGDEPARRHRVRCRPAVRHRTAHRPRRGDDRGGRRARASGTRRAAGSRPSSTSSPRRAACRSRVDEAAFPMLPPVKAACEMLGLDPLYVANEGVAVAVVAPEDADAVLAAARDDPSAGPPPLVGEVGEAAGASPVRLRTGLGATRPLILLAGDQLPRIC